MLGQFLALFLFAFLCGSIPFSVWLGRLAGKDVRRAGDGNPGAMNAFRSGKAWLGAPVLLLDVLKGILPVTLALRTASLPGLALALVCLAPTLGHFFSPFLRFRGGKGLSVSLGVWIALAFGPAPVVVLGSLVIWYALLEGVGWPVMLALAVLGAYFLAYQPEAVIAMVLAGQFLLLGWTHRADLARRPRLRPWFTRLLSGAHG